MNITVLGGHSSITGAKFKDKFSKMFTSQGSTTMVLNLSWSIRPVHILLYVFCGVFIMVLVPSGFRWCNSTWSGAYFKVYVLQCLLSGSGAFCFPLVQFHTVLVQVKLRYVVD